MVNTHLKDALEEWVRQAASDAVDPKRMTVEINCKHRFSRGFLLSVGCDTYRNEGGPYPDVGYETINVWTCGSIVRELSIDDLCGGLPKCREQLMETIKKHTSGSKLKEFWPQVEDAASFGGDPLADFAVGPKELLFSLREYLPHVADGIGVVSVPIDHLLGSFKGGSVFEKVVGKSAQTGSRMDLQSQTKPTPILNLPRSPS